MGQADAIPSWDAQCAIIPRLLQALKDHCTDCGLYTRCPGRTDIARSLRLLHHSSELVALEVTINATQFQALAELRSILTTSLKLRKLQVSFLGSSAEANNPALCLPGLQLPPLRILRLRRMRLTDYRQVGWERCVRWELLEHLQCVDIGFLPATSASLQRLRSLDIHLLHSGLLTNEQYSELVKFVETSTKLERLSMQGMKLNLDRYEFGKGKYTSLKDLSIHEDDENDQLPYPFQMHPLDISDLGKACPNLQTFRIDLEIGADEWVSTVAKLPSPLVAFIAKNMTVVAMGHAIVYCRISLVRRRT